MTLDGDLGALLTDLSVAPEEVVRLPHLEVSANLTRSYRIRLASGRLVKGVEVGSERRAQTIEQAVTRLGHRALPELLGRLRSALVFEWLFGHRPPVAEPDAAAAAGRLLGQLHASAPPGLTAEVRLTPPGALERLERDLAGLVERSVVDRAVAARLATWAGEAAPEERAVVFVHTDLCPENLLVAAGDLCIIDNGSWAVGPPDYDLARSTWRWPMTATERSRFLAAYEHASGRAPHLESLPFWVVVAAVGSTAYRVDGHPEQLARAGARLVALASLAGAPGRNVLLRCPT